MTRRLILAAVLALALAGCRVVPPPFVQHSPPRAYCTNEPTIGPDGRAVNHVRCTSPGSPGSLGR